MLRPDVEAMPRDRLRALQLERLRRQVSRLYRHSPFYRQRMDAAGVSPRDIRSLDDIRRLPFTTRQDLLEMQRRSPPLGDHLVPPRERWVEIHPSSGEVPLYMVWSKADVARITDMAARALYSAGARPGDLIHNALGYGLWVGGLAAHYGATAAGMVVIPIGTDSLRRQIEYLVNWAPRVLLTTPSQGLYLAEQIRERGLGPADLGLEVGIFAAEPGVEHPSTRQRLERALGLDAYDLYGLSEVTPIMAAECEAKAGLHWPEDHHLVEIIHPRTLEPVRPGEVGILVFTDLTRDALPLLRYWTNDYATWTDEPCACGRTLLRSPGGVLGRSDQLVIFRGAKFYPAELERILHEYPELGEEYRLVLERDPATLVDRCTLVVETAPQALWEGPQLAERLQRHLRDELRLVAEVRVVRYGSLERTMRQSRRVQDLRAVGPGAAQTVPGAIPGW
ncbi:phenylacetate--CoA ligase family protein [Caldinitratiruptor microaerophilus]|nr:phenylacetate--CoA ligase [Caldinitratiruptor microaerophilus]